MIVKTLTAAIAGALLAAGIASTARAAPQSRADVIYPYEMKTRYPFVYKHYLAQIPAPLRTETWLTQLHGPSLPLDWVTIGSERWLRGHVCESQNCSARSATILLNTKDRILVYVEWTEVAHANDGDHRVPTVFLIGAATDHEAACARVLTDDTRTAC
jgi:hypothetical protein